MATIQAPNGAIVGGQISRVVVALLGGGGDAGRADPVRAHHDRVLGAVLVEVVRAHRRRVLGAELEDVADLDHRLDVQRAAAQRAPVAVLDELDVGDVGLVVAPERRCLRCQPVRFAPATKSPPQRPVGDDPPHPPVDRPGRSSRASRRTRPRSPRPGRAEVLAERLSQLQLVQPPVAAHQRQHHLPSSATTGIALLGGARVDRRGTRPARRSSSTSGVSTSSAGAPAGTPARSAARSPSRRWRRSRSVAQAPPVLARGDGAMYSCAPRPPIIPVSDSTL